MHLLFCVFQLTENGAIETEETFSERAVLLTPLKVRCTLPEMGSFKITVSNTVETVSEQHVVYIRFNSLCMTCNAANGHCTSKVCLIICSYPRIK